MNNPIRIRPIKCRVYFRQKAFFGIGWSMGQLILTALLMCLMQLPSASQMTSKREVDYGKAIEELIKLGFPDAKGAKYVKSSDGNLEYSDRNFSTVMSSDKRPSLTGNGFYLPSSDNPKTGKFFTLGGGSLVYSATPASARDYQAYSGIRRVSGTMKDADLKKDIEEMKQWALKQSVDSSFRYYASNQYSAVLGFASLAYQAGMKDEANELMKVIFLNHENPEQIIDKLIDGLATTELAELQAEFNKNQDWESYHAGLVRLDEKFPRGWADHPGLSILIPLVKDRVDKKPVPIPTIDGHEFNEEIKNLLEQTVTGAKEGQNEYYGRNNLFLIDKVEVSDKAPAMMQLTKHGMDGFIALVALVGDQTLVSYNLQGNYGRSYGSHYSYGMKNEIKSAEAAYASLQKPQTRGEMALQIVRAALPHENEMRDMQDDQLRGLAIDWWKEHRNDDKFTLIKHYFQHGNSSHTSSLAMTLINQNTEESRKLFEENILMSATPQQHAELVKMYVKKRRAKAKGFIESYEKVLLEKLGELTNKETDYSAYHITEAGGTRKFIASLMQFTEELKPDALFENLAKMGSNTQSIMEMLGTVYSDDELTAVIPRFIKIAAQTEDKKKSIEIIEILYNMLFYGDRSNTDGFSAPVPEIKTAPKKNSLTEDEKKDWKKLLDQKNAGGSSRRMDVVGMLLDKYVHPDRSEEDYELLWGLGTGVVDELIKSRSMAILEGKEAEPLPSTDLVSDDKKQKIIAELATVSSLKFREMYSALNYSERLVIMQDPTSRNKFKEAAAFIKGIEIDEANEDLKNANTSQMKELFKPMLDKQVGAETYAELAKITMENIALFEGLAVSPQMSLKLPGRDITISKSSMVYFPEVDVLMEEIVASKKEAALVMVVSEGRGRRRGGGEQSQVFIFDKGTPIDAAKLGEITESNTVTITPVTKKVIEDWKKNQSKGKEQIVEELILLQPSFQDMRATLQQMELEDLEDALDQMRNR